MFGFGKKDSVTGQLHGGGVLVSGHRSIGLIFRAAERCATDVSNPDAFPFYEGLIKCVLSTDKHERPTKLAIPAGSVEGVVDVVASYAIEIGGPRLHKRATQFIGAIVLAQHGTQPPEAS